MFRDACNLKTFLLHIHDGHMFIFAFIDKFIFFFHVNNAHADMYCLFKHIRSRYWWIQRDKQTHHYDDNSHPAFSVSTRAKYRHRTLHSSLTQYFASHLCNVWHGNMETWSTLSVASRTSMHVFAKDDSIINGNRFKVFSAVWSCIINAMQSSD